MSRVFFYSKISALLGGRMSVRLIGQGLGNKGGRGADVVINVCFSGVYSSI